MMIGEIAALGAAISWTVSAVLYKEALLKTKPVPANITRLTCTSIILLTFFIAIGKFKVLMELPVAVAILASISGIIGLGVGDTLYMVGLKLVGVARAVPITCTYPLFNLLWAFFLKGEQISLPITVGAFTIVFGIWLLSSEENTNVAVIEKKSLLKGVGASLGAAISWSISISLINLAVTQPETGSLDHALAINTLRVMAVALFLLVVSPIIDRKFGFLKIQKKTLAALIFGGLVALGLGWFFLTYSFINTLESRAVPISSTTPLFSTLSAIIFLHEKVTAKSAVGSVAVVAGIFLIFMF